MSKPVDRSCFSTLETFTQKHRAGSALLVACLIITTIGLTIALVFSATHSSYLGRLVFGLPLLAVSGLTGMFVCMWLKNQKAVPKKTELSQEKPSDLAWASEKDFHATCSTQDFSISDRSASTLNATATCFGDARRVRKEADPGHYQIIQCGETPFYTVVVQKGDQTVKALIRESTRQKGQFRCVFSLEEYRESSFLFTLPQLISIVRCRNFPPDNLRSSDLCKQPHVARTGFKIFTTDHGIKKYYIVNQEGWLQEVTKEQIFRFVAFLEEHPEAMM